MNSKQALSTYSLTRKERLRGSRATDRVFSEGRRGFAYPLRCFYIVEDVAMGAECLPMLLFSVPKKSFKRAVKRNLLKRRMREAYRLNKSLITCHPGMRGKVVNIALVYSAKEVLDYKTIENGVRKVLEAIARGS